MALLVNDTSYSGTVASKFWLPATYGMDTLVKGAAYVVDGIKKTHTIERLDFSAPLQARAATPVSSGNFTLDGKVLDPKETMVYTEFNPRSLELNWLAEQLNPKLLARELPLTAENYMMQMALNRTFEQIELGLWMGSQTYTAIAGTPGNGQIKFWDGYLKKMVNDAAVQKVASPLPLTSGPTTVTNYNILDALNALINLGVTNKKALFTNASKFKRMRFFVSVLTEQIYQDASVNIPLKGQLPQSGQAQPWKGYEVIALAGIPDNTIVFCEGLDDPTSNLYIGMNSEEDNDLEIKRVSNPSELFYFKGLMKYDVQYGFSEEIFLFTTLTPASFNV